jgi:uncharacterized protein (DUF1810 family)
MADLHRFLAAQDNGVFDTALAELTAGAKRTHWMWFVFPQIAGLGHSDMARRYAIGDVAEARAYLAHPVLGARYRAAVAALLPHRQEDAAAIMGGVDAMKLRSSLTLFVAAGAGGEAETLLTAFFGSPDPATLARL